jgi:muramoyltetrapeptide carboxypeptidase
MKMKTPSYIQKGYTVAIISTARKISLIEIEAAINLLTSWGLKVVVGKTIGLENNQFAGTVQERIDDFQSVLDDESVKAVWCARGGYGTVQLIDYLNFNTFIKYPKWIIGYSDITVLHAHIHNLGIETIHATMPVNIPKNSTESIESLKNVLFGNPLKYEFLSHDMNIFGNAKGQLIGGNLSVLYSLLGSESSISTENKILFIEDLDEYLYHIDRMLQNLKRNGYFENLNGIIVGGMTQMNDNEIKYGKTAEEIILEIVKPYNIPVVFGTPFGHLDDNKALILGRTIQLISTADTVQIIFDN